MGIKFRCHACEKKLHVKEFLAGKRGVCPRCGAKVTIPHESQDTRRTAAASAAAIQERPSDGATVSTVPSPSLSQTQQTPSTVLEAANRNQQADSTGPQQQQEEADPIADAPDAVWYVRPPSGGEYGPANGEVMQRWLDEGRVSSDSMVWREGWPDWRQAGPLFSLFADTQQAGVDVPLDSVPAQSGDDPSSNDPFPITAETKTGRRRTATTGRKTGRRRVTTITIMSVVFVILLIVLAFVLSGQG